jgi:tetratricopeptide (TPR) repeat protein
MDAVLKHEISGWTPAKDNLQRAASFGFGERNLCFVTGYRQFTVGDNQPAAGKIYEEIRWQQAIDVYRAALAVNNRDAEIHVDLARVMYKAGNPFEVVIAEIQRGIDLAPSNATYFVEMGHVYATEKQFADALAWYQKGTAADPTSALPRLE